MYYQEEEFLLVELQDGDSLCKSVLSLEDFSARDLPLRSSLVVPRREMVGESSGDEVEVLLLSKQPDVDLRSRRILFGWYSPRVA